MNLWLIEVDVNNILCKPDTKIRRLVVQAKTEDRAKTIATNKLHKHYPEAERYCAWGEVYQMLSVTRLIVLDENEERVIHFY